MVFLRRLNDGSTSYHQCSSNFASAYRAGIIPRSDGYGDVRNFMLNDDPCSGRWCMNYPELDKVCTCSGIDGYLSFCAELKGGSPSKYNFN